VKKLSIFLITALLAATPAAAQIKYVAVVETDVDAQSGASDQLNPADVRLITAELRREAVKNLPRDRYNIMTSETVQAQGGAVLEACADENCVITLGSKIGADYIVRGTISKFQKKFALTVEMYETENGTLVASSDPVRSEKASELLEKVAAACAGMYKTFADSQNSAAAKAPELKPKPDAGIAQRPAAKKRYKLTAALGADAVGAGLIVYGLYYESRVKSYVDDGKYKNRAEYDDANGAAARRNIGYIVGGALLLSGISIHIFF